MNDTLQQSNQELQQFAHVASHDLREPLRKIKTYTGRLQQDTHNQLSEKSRLFLDKIVSASDRMFMMIEGVLNYSVLNASEQRIEPVDLDATMNNIESDLEIPINQKNAMIERENLPIIEGSSVLLYQVLYNLVNNSLKFSRPGLAPYIKVGCSQIIIEGQDWVQIKVEDNGIGFENEFAEKIFESFARLNSKDQFEGTGLGLALCKRIAERHGGHIEASGVPGKGAQFTVSLPKHQSRSSI